MSSFNIGDMVLVTKGRSTIFYEVIFKDDDVYWISDGKVQIRKEPEYMTLICRADSRLDGKVPRMNYFK